MPRLMATNDDQVINIPGPGNFQFSAIRIEDLGASEYTLTTSVFDLSGSVVRFAPEILGCQKMVVEALQKSPRAANLLHRVLGFNHNIFEIHGFKDLQKIDVADYQFPTPDGMTALYDATFDAIGATLEFAIKLGKQDYDDVNGIVIITTDGVDNRSKVTPADIKNKIDEAKHNESIASLITILVALNDPTEPSSAEDIRKLTEFHVEAGIDQFINIGDATPDQLAKFANFISQSVSSQSQSLANGTPSQLLTF